MNDPIARLEAQLRAAGNLKRRLEIYAAFFRLPGDVPSRKQLEQAHVALSPLKKLRVADLRREDCRHPAAEVYLWRARLRVDPDIAEHTDALEDIRDAVRCCEDDMPAPCIRLMLEIGERLENPGEEGAAADAYRLVVKACGDGEDAARASRNKDAQRIPELRAALAEAIARLIAIGNRLERSGRYDDALTRYSQANAACGTPERPARHLLTSRRVVTDQSHLSRLLSDAHYGMGNCRRERGEYMEALEAHLTALELRESLVQDTLTGMELVAASFAAVARVHALLGNNEKADDLYESSLETAKACEEKHLLAIPVAEAYEHLAAASLALRRPDEARDRARRAGVLYREMKEEYGSVRVRVLVGDIDVAESKWKAAAKQYAGAYVALEKLKQTRLLAALLVRIGCLHREQGPPDTALPWLLDAFTMAEEIPEKCIQRDAACELAATYELMERYRQALEYCRRTAELDAELNRDDRRRRLDELQGAFDPAQAQRTEATLRVVQQELVRRSNRLTILGAQLVQKSQRLTRLMAQAQNLEKALLQGGCKPIPSLLGDMISDINSALRADDDWNTFVELLENVHPGVVRDIEARFPELTPTELRVAAMHVAEFPVKQIAETFCTEVTTINKHDERIRRKVNYPGHGDLGAFFRSFMDDPE